MCLREEAKTCPSGLIVVLRLRLMKFWKLLVIKQNCLKINNLGVSYCEAHKVGGGGMEIDRSNLHFPPPSPTTIAQYCTIFPIATSTNENQTSERFNLS